MEQKKQNQEEEEELKGMKRQEIYSVSKLEIISDKEMETRADPWLMQVVLAPLTSNQFTLAQDLDRLAELRPETNFLIWTSLLCILKFDIF